MRHLPVPTRSSSAILALAFCACAAACSAAPSSSAQEGVVLLRSYYVVLRPDVEMGRSHPPLTKFEFGGYLTEGEDAKTQMRMLSYRLTLPSLAYQFSDSARVAPGKDATIGIGFGEMISIGVSKLTRAAGAWTAEFSFKFGEREAFRRVLPIKLGQPLLFDGHLDASLPILSAITLEIRMFPPDKQGEMEEFARTIEKDRRAFALPPPTQKDQEPYLPGVGDITMPELVSHENAVYPDAARPEKRNGQVILEVVVDREGKATGPRILSSSSPEFDAPAMESAKTYRYKPAINTKTGKPVSVTMDLIMVFQYTARPEKP